jgi:hypothetical protein
MFGQKAKIGILFAPALMCAHAQWLNYPTPGTPRTPDGKPNLSAKAPRAPGGKPDLSGVWQTEFAPPGETERIFGDAVGAFVEPGDDPRTFSKYFMNILVDFKPSELPMRPEAAALTRKNAEKYSNPVSRCLPLGIPGADILSYAPFKIVQAPGVIVVMYEVDNSRRQIYTDGRKLPVDPQPTWAGYSVGKWEGDTLVVDTAGFNDKGVLDAFGHPRSEALRVQERFRRRDFGHMDLQLTVEDLKLYTKPILVKVTEVLLPDSDILEAICNENEKDRPHLLEQRDSRFDGQR